MKLYEYLPDCVIVDGKRYRMDFDFRNVLRMMEVMGNDDIMPEARDFLALKCLTKHPKNVDKVLKAVKELLFERKPGSGERITSFEQDAGMIRTAFRQEYGINLFRDKLHWLEFAELIQNLPEGNRYEEVLGIRSRPLPAPTKYNQKERELLMKAKQQCALHLSDTEAARKYDEDVGRVFNGLLGAIMASKEVKK